MAGPFTPQGRILNGTNPSIYTAVTTPLPAAGVALTAPHTIGVIPANTDLELTCITAEQGYVAGEVVKAALMQNGANYYPITIYKTSVGVGVPIITAYSLGVSHKTTGVLVGLTAANWSYRFVLRKD